MSDADRTVRLAPAECSNLAESDPAAYDAYLIDRAIDFKQMTDPESRALSHAERSAYLVEGMILNLRRNTSAEPQRDSLDRIIVARNQEAIKVTNPRTQPMTDNPDSDSATIIRAAAFAAHKHRDQRRKDVAGTPYINHPLALACVLSAEGGITDAATLCASLLHDTIEDTDTTGEEIEREFGAEVRRLVEQVTDDKSLPKAQRKLAQIDHAAHIDEKAKRIKLADKICNLRDVALAPPTGWPIERRREYFDWAKAVIDRLRGVDPRLEAIFDQAYGMRP